MNSYYTLTPRGGGRTDAVPGLPDRQFPTMIEGAAWPIRRLYRQIRQHEWDAAASGAGGTISEVPAMAIRHLTERSGHDLSFYCAMRIRQAARHAEICRRMADVCADYLREPVTRDLEGSMATRGINAVNFDADTPLEVGARVLLETIDEHRPRPILGRRAMGEHL